MTPGLFQFLTKVAGTHAPEREDQEFLDEHFIKPGTDKWKAFRKRLRSKAFVAAVKQDERSDTKLKRFSESLNRHYTGKGETFQVPSLSSARTYTVKFHPDKDSFSCSCGDWTYAQSVKKNKQECKHVLMVKRELNAQGTKLKKEASSRVASMMLEVFG